MKEQHPIQGLMVTALENLKEMVDVNKIVGDAIETPEGHVIIPVSKVSFGFAAGGTEFETETGGQQNKGTDESFPFGGGSGGGVSVQPVAFLVVGVGEVRLLSVERHAVLDRVVDLAPQLIQQIQEMMGSSEQRPRRRY